MIGKAAHSAEWLLGIDVGTSGVKGLAITLDGQALARASVETHMYRPRPGWAENDPEDWLRGVVGCVRQLLASTAVDPEALVGMSIVSQRDPWVILDREDRVLAPSISWTDRRSEEEVTELCDQFGRPWLIERTGVLPIPGLGLPTLLWTQRHRPEVWAAAHRLTSPKDYVLWRLTGCRDTDISMPARSVMNDVARDDWCPEICEGSNIALELLPPVTWMPWERVAELSARAASELGLRPGVPIAAGGGDDTSATLGAAVMGDGDLCAGTGTSSDWRLVTSDCAPDHTHARGDLARHVVRDRFIFEVCIESTGSSLRWFRDAFPVAGEPQSYLDLIEEARSVPPGSDGLIFLPFVDGSNRAPWFVEGATGSFLGIVSGHTRAHCVRAILEGIAYQYPATLELIAPERDRSHPITIVDGESRSELWNDLKADVLGVPLQTCEVPESAALGAAILAGQAAGVFADAPEAARSLVRVKRVHAPDPERHARYTELRAAYADVLEAVRTTYHAPRTAASQRPT